MRRVPTALSAVTALGLLAACAPTDVEQETVEDRIVAYVETELGVTPDDATCPEEIRAEVGTTMTCLIGFEGQEYDVEVEVTEEAEEPEDVGLRFQVLDFPDD